MLVRFVAGVVLAMLPALPAVAESFSIYQCSFLIKGFADEPFDLILVTDEAGQTFTYDLKSGADRPERIPVKVRPAGADASIFLFALSVPNVNTGLVYLTIQARVPKEGGPSRLSMKARRFRDVPSGSGTCTLGKASRAPY